MASASELSVYSVEAVAERRLSAFLESIQNQHTAGPVAILRRPASASDRREGIATGMQQTRDIKATAQEFEERMRVAWNKLNNMPETPPERRVKLFACRDAVRRAIAQGTDVRCIAELEDGVIWYATVHFGQSLLEFVRAKRVRTLKRKQLFLKQEVHPGDDLNMVLVTLKQRSFSTTPVNHQGHIHIELTFIQAGTGKKQIEYLRRIGLKKQGCLLPGPWAKVLEETRGSSSLDHGSPGRPPVTILQRPGNVQHRDQGNAITGPQRNDGHDWI
ncbi:hypothetical protein CYLTODRAFT_487915 [Cylindrobasidium torrendii FP15055 ss-10]|uniref:Uncharacterized protein n=1 Tax=Cylindrobasidium torrendii FP15055 ss-10 TaxID=1314674 RepID=A0A0D7BJ94_9AGAR|nr:hypothetical protein CYLTODRAFT_487915 [Cylindrobasidium torrendii FP15055 ss-10]